MQPRTRLLSAFTLSTAIAFGVVAMAADLPKEGTFSGTLSNFGTVKATPVGKERLLVMFDENGSVVSSGLLDHTTVHCWGLGDYTNGVGQAHGYCVSMDPAGDQIVINITGDGRLDAKSFNGTATFTTGTGKYAGISGGYTIILHGPEFRTAAEGTYVQYGKMEGSYTLP
jgi:hypothetical protein